jgi:hypothetical protein
MSAHAIRCRRTGEAIASKLDGGVCVCASIAECALHAEPRKVIYEDNEITVTIPAGRKQ